MNKKTKVNSETTSPKGLATAACYACGGEWKIWKVRAEVRCKAIEENARTKTILMALNGNRINEAEAMNELKSIFL